MFYLLAWTWPQEGPGKYVKKVVSDSPGLVDCGMGRADFFLNLPDGQVKIFEGIQITEELL